MKTVAEVHAVRRAVQDQLIRAERAAVGAPNHDALIASAHAYAYGQLQGLLDLLEREGLSPDRSRPLPTAPDRCSVPDPQGG